MDTRDTILTGAYLLRASPETVYDWLKALPKRTAEDRFGHDSPDIPQDIELQLVERKNEIVDLALAAWGTHNETLAVLYQRWCARSVAAEWPPQPSTFSYAILLAILGNVGAAGVIFDRLDDRANPFWPFPNVDRNVPSPNLDSERLKGIPSEDFDWLIEHGDDNLLYTLHSNIGPAPGLLKDCAARLGAYQRIDDWRWLTILAILGLNKGLRVPAWEDDYDGYPDFRHSNIHDAFVEAVTISPKTSEASETFWRIFADLPTTATEGAYISDEALNAALDLAKKLDSFNL